MSRRRWTGCVWACLVAAFTAPTCPVAAAPAAVKLHYTADLLGVDALEFSVVIAEIDGRYRIQVAGMTEGMVDWLVGWRSFTTVDGALQTSDARPEDYHALNLFRSRRSEVTMRYAPDGRIEAAADPPPGDDRDPVSDEQRRSTVDTLTAGLVLGRRLASTGSCDGPIQVFDGRRRYDLMLEDGGRSAVALRKNLPRIDAAQICWFRINRIAGFKKKGQTYDKPEYHDRRYRITTARIVEGFPPLALDVSGEFSLGRFHVQLVKMEQGEPSRLFATKPPFEFPKNRPAPSPSDSSR